MGNTWTADQQKVIDTRNKNILVSAAAGSGKTAVLVERIIKLITSPDSDVNIDELLVVTFTEAAAAEMKDRIMKALEKLLEEDPSNERAARQMSLIHTASISTIHSFCLEVIRSHFNEIDLDPSFRTGDDGEMKLLRNDVITELLEECYIDDPGIERKVPVSLEDFYNLVESVETGRAGNKIQNAVLKLYNYAMSYAIPEEWLKKCVSAYSEDTLVRAARRALEQIGNLADISEYISERCTKEVLPQAYGPFLEKEAEAMRNTFNMAASYYEECEKTGEFSYDHFRDIVLSMVFERMPVARKKEEYDPVARDAVKNCRDGVKKDYGKIRENYFYDCSKEILEDLALSGRVIGTLVELTSEFSRRFDAAKRARNLIDFSDMEHLALRILTKYEEGSLVATPAAWEYKRQFKEVMTDEYQDSSYLQEAILSSVSRSVEEGFKASDRFMVGDVKQSIYGFRMSRPELFIDKYKKYASADDSVKIDLHMNFRSRRIIIDSVNTLMRSVMRREVGGIEYDRDQELVMGPDDTAIPDPRSYVIILDKDKYFIDSNNLDSRAPEACAVGLFIKKLMEEHKQVYDKKTGTLRPVKYGDIAILTRAAAGRHDLYRTVLMNQGIPAIAQSRTGYFDAMEIRTMLDYLRLIDNPRQDIAMASVMRSPIGGFSNDEMAAVRLSSKKSSFAEAVLKMARGHSEDEGADAHLTDKVTAFIDMIGRHRKMISYTPLHELIEFILEDTGYGYYINALPEGTRRRANMEFLIRKAENYEEISYKGVFNFLRYLDQLRAQEVDYGESSATDENNDAVQIMTIHKSKGLEFPVVIVSDLGSGIDKSEADPVINGVYGAAINSIDTEKRLKKPSILKKLIQEKNREEEYGEELRILYVAATRARDILAFTGTVENLDEKRLPEWYATPRKDHVITRGGIMSASNYLDFIMPAVLENPDLFAVDYIRMPELTEALTKQSVSSMIDAGIVKAQLDPVNIYDGELEDKLKKSEEYVYPYAKAVASSVKTSVSDIKLAHITEVGEEGTSDGESPFAPQKPSPYVPEFLMEREENGGALRGTYYHRFLELWDYATEPTRVGIVKAMDNMLREGKLEKKARKIINPSDMQAFFESPIGLELKKASDKGRLHREQIFMMGVPFDNEPDHDISREGTGCDDTTDAGNAGHEIDRIYGKLDSDFRLIQGIIDAYYEDDNGDLVILDYKTDRVASGEELVERYKVQLDLYAEALSRLTEQKVVKKVIYSFALKQMLEC